MRKLMEELLSIKKEISPADFSAMPFPNAKGYHSKTIAYSIGAPIITTGNELAGPQITDFSRMLNIDVLYKYTTAVKNSTLDFLQDALLI